MLIPAMRSFRLFSVFDIFLVIFATCFTPCCWNTVMVVASDNAYTLWNTIKFLFFLRNSNSSATPTGTRVESRTADFTHMLLSQ